jgi:hypothetical protein
MLVIVELVCSLQQEYFHEYYVRMDARPSFFHVVAKPLQAKPRQAKPRQAKPPARFFAWLMRRSRTLTTQYCISIESLNSPATSGGIFAEILSFKTYAETRRESFTPRRCQPHTSTASDLPLNVIHVGSNTSIAVMETLATDALAAVKIHCTILSVANLCRGSVLVIPPFVIPD